MLYIGSDLNHTMDQRTVLVGYNRKGHIDTQYQMTRFRLLGTAQAVSIRLHNSELYSPKNVR